MSDYEERLEQEEMLRLEQEEMLRKEESVDGLGHCQIYIGVPDFLSLYPSIIRGYNNDNKY